LVRAAARNIPFNHHVRSVLDSLPRELPKAPVFLYRSKPIAKLTRALRTACGSAGILYSEQVEGGFRFRDIRTTVQTNMENARFGPKFVKYRVGHTQAGQAGMDKHYFRSSEQDVRIQMDRYTAWLDAQMEVISEKVEKSVKMSPNTVVADNASA